MKKLLLLTLIFCQTFYIAHAQEPSWLWAKSAGGTDYERGLDIATDAGKNVYVTGLFSSANITFGSYTLSNAGDSSTDIFVVKYDSLGNVLWAKAAGGTESDKGTVITSDVGGNVYITGFFSSNSITFGSYTLKSADHYRDIFVVKYDRSGNVIWAKSVGGKSDAEGAGIASDPKGNVYVTGSFSSESITFDSCILNNGGYTNIFVVKYDGLGNVLWAKSEGGTRFDYSYGIAADTGGNVYVTGSFSSEKITFGSYILNNRGYNNIFVVKYDSFGSILWAKSEGGTMNDYSYGIAADAGGNVYVTGLLSSDSINFDSYTLKNTRFPYSDIFIVKYDNWGNVLWVKQAGGPANDFSVSNVIDKGENVYITGYFKSSSINFSAHTLNNAGGYDVFVAKLGTIGTGTGENLISREYASIVPNPSSGIFTINSSEKIHSYEILNLSGLRIKNSELIKEQSEVDLSKEPKGVYFIKLISEKGIETKKLVLQ